LFWKKPASWWNRNNENDHKEKEIFEEEFPCFGYECDKYLKASFFLCISQAVNIKKLLMITEGNFFSKRKKIIKPSKKLRKNVISQQILKSQGHPKKLVDSVVNSENYY